jgi:hypothetical protein
LSVLVLLYLLEQRSLLVLFLRRALAQLLSQATRQPHLRSPLLESGLHLSSAKGLALVSSHQVALVRSQQSGLRGWLVHLAQVALVLFPL